MTIPILSVVAAKSNTGKTTLIEKLIPKLQELGINTAVIKGDVHGFEMDKQGKDTWRFTQAGAKVIAISSPEKFALIHQTKERYSLEKIISMISGVDLILVEGRKICQKPKIEVIRKAVGTEVISEQDELIAVATDCQELSLGVPKFDINDANGLAIFIQEYFNLNDPDLSLTHFDQEGRARMVDVTDKVETQREAVARGEVWMRPATLDLVKKGKIGKGDVLGVAQVAGIMGVKETSRLIPMCHPLNISGANLSFNIDEINSKIDIEATVKLKGQTGVEMEALTGVSLAALTIYDMCKAVDKTMVIKNIRLAQKRGGKSGAIILE